MPPPTTISLLLTSPFLHHALIELPASLQFLLLPSRQLPRPAPQAHALIRQYALLLFSSVLIGVAFALHETRHHYHHHHHDYDYPQQGRIISGQDHDDDGDALSAQVAIALGLYHVGPVIRSGARVWRAVIGSRSQGRGPGGRGRDVEALVYVVLHLVAGGRLFAKGWGWLRA